jgi:hypothetical protein
MFCLYMKFKRFLLQEFHRTLIAYMREISCMFLDMIIHSILARFSDSTMRAHVISFGVANIRNWHGFEFSCWQRGGVPCFQFFEECRRRGASYLLCELNA